VAVVVEVGGGESAPVDTGELVRADELRRVDEPALDVLEHLNRPCVTGEVLDRDLAVREHEVEVAVVVQVDPRVAPAGQVPAEGGDEGLARVGEAAQTGAVDRMGLAARVRDEEVGAAVARVVGRRDAHPGVRVGDAVARALLDQPEPERSA